MLGSVTGEPDGPTSYSDVNRFLRLLLTEQQAVLGSRLVGLYLYGSLSLGDFDPASSDIDFLAVTDGALESALVEALAAMHRRLSMVPSHWATHLEGWYMPRGAVRRYDAASGPMPTLGVDWDFGRAERRPSWLLEQQILHQHGVAVFGPPPRELIDPVRPEELRAAVRDMLRGFWAAQLREPEPEWLRPRHYQAFAVLTMCRARYTLAHGAVVSKPKAARWALANLDPRWSDLIAQALLWRHQSEPEDLATTLGFIRATVDICRREHP